MNKIWNALLSAVLVTSVWLLSPSMALASASSLVQPLSPPSLAHLSTRLPLVSYETFAFLRWIFGRRQKEDDRPASTDSAGRRGPCNQVSQELVAFIPSVKPPSGLESDEPLSTEIESSIELTTQTTTDLWFYLPKHPERVSRAELMLQDEQNQDVIAAPISIPLPTSSGAFKIDLKTEELTLPVDTPYHWYISIVCNAERPSQNPSVDAWIQRIFLTSDLEAQLASIVNPRDRVDVYLEQAIWHDALSQLAALRCRSPEDEALSEDWITLLESIGISENVAAEPILSCPSLS